MTPEALPLRLHGVHHAYGATTALAGLDLDVHAGETVALLGPNGSGKTTLFRLITALLPPAPGSIHVFGRDVAEDPRAARARLGLLFQSPALDGVLTVRENLIHHGHLHGLAGRPLRARIDEILRVLRLTERAADRVARLSGGLRRRTDLARVLLPAPGLLLLDEPTTGLDPAARSEFWQEIERQCAVEGTAVLAATHLTDEAERATRAVILESGRIVAEGTPESLRAAVGGTVIVLRAADPERLARDLRERLSLPARAVEGTVRIPHPSGAEIVPRLASACPDGIESITVKTTTLEDVFVHHTGHRFLSPVEGAEGRT